MARRTPSGVSSGSSRRTREWASCATRTRGTRTRSGSRRTTTSECRRSSDRMPSDRGHPRVAVDGLVVHADKLVTVRRRNDPFRGMLALPGGFVELGERVEDAVVREVREETGLETRVVRLVGVFSNPKRDPRGHVVSIAYALTETAGTLRVGSDAAEVVLVDSEAIPRMAF